MEKTVTKVAGNHVSAAEFSRRIESSIQKSNETGRPFLIVLLQFGNMRAFKNQRPTHVINAFYRELLGTVRKAVHPSQFVGILQDGLGLVFDEVEVGQGDVLSKRLVMLANHVVKSGNYNDLTSRWTDIIYQFLWPNKPGIIYPCVGWSIYPRDGNGVMDLVKRAFHHIKELTR